MLSNRVAVKDTSATGVLPFQEREESLQVNLSDLQALLDSIRDLVLVLDVSGRILYVNCGVTKLLGYSKEELFGETVLKIHSPESPGEIPRGLAEILSGKAESVRIPLRSKEGARVSVEGRFARALWGGQDALIGIIRNVSDRDEPEGAGLETERVLSQPPTEEDAPGTLSKRIVHDLNNALGIIFGSTQLGLREAPDGSRIRKWLEDISEAGHRAKHLIALSLAGRGIENGKSPALFSNAIEEVAKILRTSLPSTIEIRTEVDLAPEADIVFANAGRIHRILTTLCMKAADAIHEKCGTLGMHAASVDIDSEASVAHGGLLPGPYVKLIVSGSAFETATCPPERPCDQCGSMESAGKEDSLSVIQGLVKELGGAMAVQSVPGGGGSFHVLFPWSREQATKKTVSAPQILGGTERILFIDDEQAVVNMWGKLLAPLGYNVLCKTSSIEALQVFRGMPDQFDLIITDQTMPHMSGAELARQLLSIRPDIPIILCTGFSESFTAEEAHTLGVREFLMKPLVLRSMTQTIRRALESKR
jgi:PAS domain S-box-containing protein